MVISKPSVASNGSRKSSSSPAGGVRNFLSRKQVWLVVLLIVIVHLTGRYQQRLLQQLVSASGDYSRRRFPKGDLSVCHENPYMKYLQESPQLVWQQAEDYYAGAKNGSLTNNYNSKYDQPGQARFEAFAIMGGGCQESHVACIGGECERDESKIMCGWEHIEKLQETGGGDAKGNKKTECIVYSIGGNNQWEFEEDLLGRTRCEVHCFDCTGPLSRFQVPENDRLHFHHWCLGSEYREAQEYTPHPPGQGGTAPLVGEVLTLAQIQQRLGHKHVDLLKMDVEGYEHGLVDSWIEQRETDSNAFYFPMQVMIEIHYRTGTRDLVPQEWLSLPTRENQTRTLPNGTLVVETVKMEIWHREWKTYSDLVRMNTQFLELGYTTVIRDNNRYCLGSCTELTLIRFAC